MAGYTSIMGSVPYRPDPVGLNFFVTIDAGAFGPSFCHDPLLYLIVPVMAGIAVVRVRWVVRRNDKIGYFMDVMQRPVKIDLFPLGAG
jgi:hypothetical protein